MHFFNLVVFSLPDDTVAGVFMALFAQQYTIIIMVVIIMQELL